MIFKYTSPTYGELEILIDDEDAYLLKLPALHVSKAGQHLYVKVGSDKQCLHRLIMNPPKDRNLVVDHINRNTLDNRKQNLRIVTIQENLRNQKRPNNKTGYTGVAIFPGGRYSAQIKHNYKKIHLGLFKTIEEAAVARREAEKKYWGR